MEEKKDVVFVDVYNIIYRAYHGNQSKLTNADGLPTNAIFTTLKMLQKIPRQFNNIEYVLAVFDGGGNFRKELDAEYKANRKPMPDDLKVQMPHIKRGMELLGWPMMQGENVEADDVVGTLAIRAAAKGFNVYIVSGDKDFRQIVDDNLHVIDTMNDICYDKQTVFDKMGVRVDQVRDYLALLGDASDNVKGIDKVGVKTACKWLKEYNDIDNLIENQHKISGVVGENLRTAIACGQLLKSRELVTLKTDLELLIKVKDVKFKPVDTEGWISFCTEMNFKSFLSQLPQPK